MFIGLVAGFAAPASATHSWAGMHWARTTTLTLRLGDNVGPAWDAYLVSAALDWNKSTPIDTVLYAGSRAPSTCNPTYGKIEVCNYAYGVNGWLGLANVWTQNGFIVQGTVKLNESYFSSASYNTPSWRRMVMCQEIGHTFGLDHQDVNQTNVNLGSCMDYSRDPSGLKGTNGTKNNEHPNAHDFDQLNTSYARNDGSQLSSTKASPSGLFGTNLFEGTQVSVGGPAFAGAAPLAPREWGRAIAVDSRGRARAFKRSLGNGAEVTTFVTWADGHEDDHN
ncbi:MAG: hypothetical protein ABIS38_04955 [Sphingomicrobium sp.]